MKRRFIPVLLAIVLGLAGCATVTADRSPANDLAKYKRVFVERRLNDDRGISQLITAELQKRGIDASAGPLTMMPENAEAIISYEDDWTFDFTTHMTFLEVRMRKANELQPFASSRYFQRWIAAKSPSRIVAQVMKTLYHEK